MKGILAGTLLYLHTGPSLDRALCSGVPGPESEEQNDCFHTSSGLAVRNKFRIPRGNIPQNALATRYCPLWEIAWIEVRDKFVAANWLLCPFSADCTQLVLTELIAHLVVPEDPMRCSGSLEALYIARARSGELSGATCRDGILYEPRTLSRGQLLCALGVHVTCSGNEWGFIWSSIRSIPSPFRTSSEPELLLFMGRAGCSCCGRSYLHTFLAAVTKDGPASR